MQYKAVHITTQHEWNSLITSWERANFRQSWQWGEFEESLNNDVVYLGVKSGDTFVAAGLGVIECARRGTYMSLAAGPLLDWKNISLVKYFFEQLKLKAKKNNCSWIRFRPQELQTAVPKEALKTIGAVLAPMHVTADLTLQLDITQSGDDLLKQMRKNTRWAIKKATRLGITTTVTDDRSQIFDFYQTQLKVAKRQGFVPFSQEFLLKQFDAFNKTQSVALIHSHFEEKILASAFVCFFNGEAVYHYGVSTPENAKLPGSYATQWRAILEAQARGCHTYNFWGVAPKDHKEHRFAGTSLFKRGFGGHEVEYLPAHDIPLKPQYLLTYAFETVRKITRKL